MIKSKTRKISCYKKRKYYCRKSKKCTWNKKRSVCRQKKSKKSKKVQYKKYKNNSSKILSMNDHLLNASVVRWFKLRECLNDWLDNNSKTRNDEKLRFLEELKNKYYSKKKSVLVASKSTKEYNKKRQEIIDQINQAKKFRETNHFLVNQREKLLKKWNKCTKYFADNNFFKGTNGELVWVNKDNKIMIGNKLLKNSNNIILDNKKTDPIYFQNDVKNCFGVDIDRPNLDVFSIQIKTQHRNLDEGLLKPKSKPVKLDKGDIEFFESCIKSRF